jgi:hypothetical protein
MCRDDTEWRVHGHAYAATFLLALAGAPGPRLGGERRRNQRSGDGGRGLAAWAGRGVMKAVTYLVVLTFGTASAGLRAAQPIWASAALVLFTVLAFAGASRGGSHESAGVRTSWVARPASASRCTQPGTCS